MIDPCTLEINNTMNLSELVDPNINSPINYQLTYPEIMKGLSDGLLTQILTISIIGLCLQIVCLWYISKFQWELPSILKMNWNNQELKRNKILVLMVMVNFVPSMFLPIIIILYKLGVKF